MYTAHLEVPVRSDEDGQEEVYASDEDGREEVSGG